MVIGKRLALTLVVLCFVLALTGVAVLSTVGAQVDADAASNVTITAGATGTASAPPDLAVAGVAVEASAETADAAREEVADTVAEMRTALTEANVSDDQIRTTGFVIRPERDNGTVTYRATHAFELRVPVDDAGSVVDAAVAGGATRVDGVRFTLAPETSRELRDEALADALSSARTDADTIANATGVTVDAVTSVVTTDGGVGPVFAEAARRNGTTFDPGPVTVTASVTVTYVAH